MQGENVKVKDMLMYEENRKRYVFLQIWHNKKAHYSKLQVEEAVMLYGHCPVVSTVREHGVIESMSIIRQDDRVIRGLL